MIVFRGVRVDNGEMAVGYYNKIEGGHFIFTGSMKKIYTFNRDMLGVYIMPPKGEELNASVSNIYCPIFTEIYPESLAIGDTNLKDKNGKVIFGSFEYEKGKMSRGGDILGGGFKNRDVIFQCGSFQIRGFGPLYDDGDMLKIIGNAYTNHEILEESNG